MYGIIRTQWSKSILTYLMNHRILMVMTLSLLLGVLFGGIILSQQSFQEIFSVADWFKDFLSYRIDGDIISIFLYSFSSSIVYLLFAFLFGILIFGFFPALFLPALRGLGIGLVCSYLYLTYQLKGVAFALLIVLPVSFFHGLILLIACKESLNFSLNMTSIYIGGQPQIGAKNAFKKYNLRYLVLLIFTLITCVVDGLLSVIFIHLFGF